MKFKITNKKKCSICNIEVNKYKSHLKEKHPFEYVKRKIKILHFTSTFAKLSPYIGFILLTFSIFLSDIFGVIFIIFVLFEIIFIIGYRIKTKSFLIESLAILTQESKRLKEESKKEKISDKNKSKFTIQELLDLLHNYIDKSYSEEFKIKTIQELLVKAEINHQTLTKRIENIFAENLSIFIRNLNEFMDKEELELNKFLVSKYKHHYLFWIIVQYIIFFIALVLSILFSIVEKGLSFLYIIIFLMYVFRDIQSRINRRFYKGQYRYLKNKRFLKKYGNFLSLIKYNDLFQLTLEQDGLNENIIMFESRVNNYNGILNRFFDYIKKFEFIAILSIIITYFYPFFQPSILLNFVFEHSLEVMISFLLILGLFIYPYIFSRKDEKIIKIQSELEEKLENYQKEINFSLEMNILLKSMKTE